MGTMVLIAIPLLLGSLWLNDWKTPERNDADYIRVYKITHADGKSDEEILEERQENRESTARYAHTNKLLADELGKRSIEHSVYKAQYHLDQILFHNAYYENNLTVGEFVDSQYGDK